MLMNLALTDWLATPVGETVRIVVTTAYLLTVGLICLYGLHRYHMVFLFRKHAQKLTRPGKRFESLPRVTVQLPVFNEGTVAKRIIDAAAALDYPRELLQIQVLDDSTDQSTELIRQYVDFWKEQGIDIEMHHRTNREGYKAGALADALKYATGEFVAIFDADFVPRPGFLRRTVHHFTDPSVGMVQTRWAHLNRNESMLTRGQAIFLDGHFMIEHTARNRSGAWINFNGTAGIWRRSAIEDAGGWQHDTLTEDVDLSYRAQLAGYRFVFLPRYTCPAELPPQINAFKSQQHRWTKGSIQTAIKLLPSLLRASIPWRVKTEAFFHLTSPIVYLLIILFTLLLLPAIAFNAQAIGKGTWLGVIIGTTLFGLGTASATVFYVASQWAQKRSPWKTLLQLPVLMSMGIGIALYNAIACIEAIIGYDTPFIRTPKYNRASTAAAAESAQAAEVELDDSVLFEPTEDTTSMTPRSESPTMWSNVAKILPRMSVATCFLELALGLYVVLSIGVALRNPDAWMTIPFLILFAAGYLVVGASSLMLHARKWFKVASPAPSLPTS